MRRHKDLRDKQLEAAQFLADNPHAALFAAMGTGKTIITLTHINRYPDLHTLVISTKRVVELVWRQEAAAWHHTRGITFSLASGPPEQRLRAIQGPEQVKLINIENAQWLADTGELDQFDMVVLDELSLWRGGGKRWKAVRKAFHDMPRMVGLTGTPAPNGLLQLWPQMDLVARGCLARTRTEYKREFFYTPDPQGFTWELRPGAEQQILARAEPYVMRLSADDADMPEVSYNRIPVQIPVDAARGGRMLWTQGGCTIKGTDLYAESHAVASGKMQQLGQGRVYYQPDEYSDEKLVLDVHRNKLDACWETVQELQGAPVMIAYRYHHDLDALRELWPDAPNLGAGVDERRASETVEAWNAGKHPVLLIHPDSAGHGLNLQKGGANMVWYGLTWDLDKFEQLNARLARSGQAASRVVVHMLICGEMDQVVADALVAKNDVQQAVLEYFDDA